MSNMSKFAAKLQKAITESEKKKTRPYDSQAKVLRVEDDTIWVHIAGGVDETPIKKTINAVPGDIVQVHIENGSAWVVGNSSVPPTGDARANEAYVRAEVAALAADNAVKDADRARAAADQAQIDAIGASEAATEAKKSADTAFTNLAQVQSVLEVAEWIATHGTYTKATTFNPNTTYYTLTATQVADPSDEDKDSEGVLIYYELSNDVYVRTTDTEVDTQKTYYTVTGTPVAGAKAEDIAQYYTLAVTDAMANYIKSHLALTDDGLYVMADGSEWKVKISDDGVYILDPNNQPTNRMTSTGNIIGYKGETHAEIDYHSLQLIGRGESAPYFWISDLRDRNDDYQTTITEIFKGNGAQTQFRVKLEVSEEISAVDQGDFSNKATRSYEYYTFEHAPANGAEVTIVYKTRSSLVKAYTFGYRLPLSEIGPLSVAEGYRTEASSYYSHAEGYYTTASSMSAHAEGGYTIASGDCSHAEGDSTEASGEDAHTEGEHTTASGAGAHAEGYYTTASGKYSHVEGGPDTTASSYYSHAEGCKTIASGEGAHAEGYKTIASGKYSHAEGKDNTTASGAGAHAEGSNTEANGGSSHAEGGFTITTASSYYSHAEGERTTASGAGAHAEGHCTTASNYYSHAEGNNTEASGKYSHAEGSYTTASGEDAHAEGNHTTASGDYSHAQNKGTTVEYEAQTAIGRYNDNKEENAFEIGNGTSDSDRSNAYAVDWNGNIITKDLELTRGTPPALNNYRKKITFTDSNDTELGYICTPFITDGREGIQIETTRTVNGSNIYNGIQMYINASGTPSVTLNHPAAWRTALGLEPFTPSISITSTTGTLNRYVIRQMGKLVSLTVYVYNTNSVASAQNIYQGTINTVGLRPIAYTTSATFMGARLLGGSINTAGQIILRNTTASAITTSSSNMASISFVYFVE